MMVPRRTLCNRLIFVLFRGRDPTRKRLINGHHHRPLGHSYNGFRRHLHTGEYVIVHDSAVNFHTEKCKCATADPHPPVEYPLRY